MICRAGHCPLVLHTYLIEIRPIQKYHLKVNVKEDKLLNNFVNIIHLSSKTILCEFKRHIEKGKYPRNGINTKQKTFTFLSLSQLLKFIFPNSFKPENT